MNLNLGLNPPQSKEAETLYKLAYQCVHMKATMRCNMCPNCTYNIFNYGWHPSEAKLIKARAVMDYQNAIADEQQRRKNYWRTELVIIGSALGVLLLFAIIMQALGMGLFASAVPPPTAAPATTSIEVTVQQVRSNLRDVNADNMINCIDYSIVFYELYPNSRLIRCWDNAELNHMLNQVNGKYIEPQRPDGDPYKLWPTFKTAHKKDVTDKWNYLATRKSW